jgi:hypothetical protein
MAPPAFSHGWQEGAPSQVSPRLWPEPPALPTPITGPRPQNSPRALIVVKGPLDEGP